MTGGLMTPSLHDRTTATAAAWEASTTATS